MTLLRERITQFGNRVYRSLNRHGGIWLPDQQEDVVPRRRNVLAVLRPEDRRKLPLVFGAIPHFFWPERDDGFLPASHILRLLAGGALPVPGKNLVTDAGDLHYAERLENDYNSTGAPTNAFTTHEMAEAGPVSAGKTDDRSDYTVIAGSQKVDDTGYPKINDGDSNNSGAGVDVVTHKVAYTAGDFDTEGANDISDGIKTNASPGASEPLLTGYAFAASFAKDSSTALDVFVNHPLLGV